MQIREPKELENLIKKEIREDMNIKMIYRMNHVHQEHLEKEDFQNK